MVKVQLWGCGQCRTGRRAGSAGPETPNLILGNQPALLPLPHAGPVRPGLRLILHLIPDLAALFPNTWPLHRMFTLPGALCSGSWHGWLSILRWDFPGHHLRGDCPFQRASPCPFTSPPHTPACSLHTLRHFLIHHCAHSLSAPALRGCQLREGRERFCVLLRDPSPPAGH